jgi:hypothetical protein
MTTGGTDIFHHYVNFLVAIRVCVPARNPKDMKDLTFYILTPRLGLKAFSAQEQLPCNIFFLK